MPPPPVSIGSGQSYTAVRSHPLKSDPCHSIRGHPQISVGSGPEQGPYSSLGGRRGPALTEPVRGPAGRNNFRVRAGNHVGRWAVWGAGGALRLRSAERGEGKSSSDGCAELLLPKKTEPPEPWDGEGKRRPGSKVDSGEPRLRYSFGPEPLTLGRGVPGRHDTAGGQY